MADEYAVAPGFNNVAGYVTLAGYVISTRPMAHVQGVGSYDPGEERFYIDGTRDDVGDAMLTWLITRMTWEQYEWFLSTPLAGRRSNRVTTRTRTTGAAYINTNSIMTLPKTSTLNRVRGWYLDVSITISIQGTL